VNAMLGGESDDVFWRDLCKQVVRGERAGSGGIITAI
jgi:hypothetical protein